MLPTTTTTTTTQECLRNSWKFILGQFDGESLETECAGWGGVSSGQAHKCLKGTKSCVLIFFLFCSCTCHVRQLEPKKKKKFGGRFGNFFIFSARGRRRESWVTGRGGGVRFFFGFWFKSPGGAGGSPRRGEGGEGAGMVSARNLGGGGLNIFFRGRNAHQEKCVLIFLSLSLSLAISFLSALLFVQLFCGWMSTTTCSSGASLCCSRASSLVKLQRQKLWCKALHFGPKSWSVYPLTQNYYLRKIILK